MYRPSNEDLSVTLCHREAFISSSIRGLSRSVEAFVLERLKKNASKASDGLNYVLDKMFPVDIPAAPALSNAEKLRLQAQKASSVAKSKGAGVVASVSGSTVKS